MSTSFLIPSSAIIFWSSGNDAIVASKSVSSAAAWLIFLGVDDRAGSDGVGSGDPLLASTGVSIESSGFAVVGFFVESLVIFSLVNFCSVVIELCRKLILPFHADNARRSLRSGEIIV